DRVVSRVRAHFLLEAAELCPGEEGEPDVDVGAVLGPVSSRGASGAAATGFARAVHDHHLAEPAAGQVPRHARTGHAATDDDDGSVPHAVKTCSGWRNDLNSSALPLGSSRNIVACSPGWPS